MVRVVSRVCGGGGLGGAGGGLERGRLRAALAREPRVLVGQDAIGAAWIQRLFPIGYWKIIARKLARDLRGPG